MHYNIDIDYYNIENLRAYNHEIVLVTLENDYWGCKMFLSQALQYLLNVDKCILAY